MMDYAFHRKRLDGLERWLQVGDRSLCVRSVDQDLLGTHEDSEIPDVVNTLRRRCVAAREELWACTPEPPEDAHLQVAASSIPGAGMGLFSTVDLEAGVDVCYYVGWEHTLQSAMSVQDREYMIRLGPRTDSGRSHDEIASGCVYIDARSMTKAKARFLNDCSNAQGYNVKFVCEPELARARVVTLRPVRQGEELFVAYGESYWQACDVTPRALTDAELEMVREGRRPDDRGGACCIPTGNDSTAAVSEADGAPGSSPARKMSEDSDLDPEVWGMLSNSAT